MKTILSLTVLLATLAVAAAEQPAIVYRGRLVKALDPAADAFDSATTRRITCRVYNGEIDATPVFESVQDNVTIAKDGSFELLLQGDALTAAIVAGTARYVGVAVGTAPEIMPRRRLLPLPRVTHASTAEALGNSGRIAELSVTNVLATTELSVGTLSVGGTLSSASQTGTVNLSCVTPESGKTVNFGRAGNTQVFSSEAGRGWREVASVGSCRKAQRLWTATDDGVVLLHQKTPPSSGDRVLAIPVFCEKGDDIISPCTLKGNLTVSFRPFIGR